MGIYEGFWWSHIGWLMDWKVTERRTGDQTNAKEMQDQPFYTHMQKHYSWQSPARWPCFSPWAGCPPSSGGAACASAGCGTSPGSSTPRPTSGGTRTLPPGTTPGTTGGSASSPSARAGTTTTTPLTSPPATASGEAVRHDLDHRARPAVPGPCHQGAPADREGHAAARRRPLQPGAPPNRVLLGRTSRGEHLSPT